MKYIVYDLATNKELETFETPEQAIVKLLELKFHHHQFTIIQR